MQSLPVAVWSVRRS